MKRMNRRLLLLRRLRPMKRIMQWAWDNGFVQGADSPFLPIYRHYQELLHREIDSYNRATNIYDWDTAPTRYEFE